MLDVFVKLESRNLLEICRHYSHWKRIWTLENWRGESYSEWLIFQCQVVCRVRMEFETNLGLGDEPLSLFGDLDNIPFFENEDLDFKKSPGHESVMSDQDGPGPSPSFEAANIDFEAILKEHGITVEDQDGVISLNAEDMQLEAAAQEPEIDVSEAPSSPQSVSDVESYSAPSPAPSTVGRKTRSATRVRVASAASLSPVHENDEDPKRNKAAVQAKINREKKKAYMASLQNDKETLQKENSDLRDSNQRLTEDNKSLNEEIVYLKRVLANQSTLSNLLQNIPNVEGVCLTTSFSESRKRSAAHDHDYGAPQTKRGRSTEVASSAQGGGVCLHVAGNSVSIEFCRVCASQGQSSSTKKS